MHILSRIRVYKRYFNKAKCMYFESKLSKSTQKEAFTAFILQ